MTDDVKARLAAEMRQMLRETARWPWYPLLPVKNHKEEYREADGFPKVGLLADGHLDPPVVFLVNMLAVADGEAALKDAPVKKYASVDAMIEDGWMVD